MIRKFKQKLYFFVAAYFRFFAGVVLRRWKPIIVTVVGSSGKTTLLHLLEAQIGQRAVYSHKANSSFGIPFHVLGLERKSFSLVEWPIFALLAPFKIFRSTPKEEMYVVEADVDRPGEGQFLAPFLHPDILIWLSLDEAHGMNFDKLVEGNGDVRDAIKKEMAHEFGYFVAATKKQAILNLENSYIAAESKRASAEVISVSEKEATALGFSLPYLVPPAVDLSVVAVEKVIKILGLPFDSKFSKFVLPPGRSSVFVGKMNTTLIDSTYNATIDGMRTMLELFKSYTARGAKVMVLGDMIEQGRSEEFEHKDLAQMILSASAAQVVLVGPRLQKYTYPLLKGKVAVTAFLMPGEALEFLQKNLKGGETILFKGARFLEGVVEKMLQNPADAAKLCRRELVWIKRRAKFGI